MLGPGRRRRRVLVGAGGLLVLAVALPFLALRAGASDAVTNPGNVDVSLSLSVLTLGQNELGIQTLGPARGTVDRKGTLTIPGAGITFAPISLSVDVGEAQPAIIVVDTVALGDFRGRVDPRGGLVTVVGAVEERWSWQGTDTDCPLGPIVIEATSAAQGGRAYAEATGEASTVDDHVSIAAVPPNTVGCDGLEDVINSELHLPITPPPPTTTSVPKVSTAANAAATESTTTLAPATSTTATVAPDAGATTSGSRSPLPPPVPSIVLSISISPPPSAHARRAPTTTAHAPTSTTAAPPKSTTMPAPPPRLHEPPHPKPNEHASANSRNRALEAERQQARRALTLALARDRAKNKTTPSSTVPKRASTPPNTLAAGPPIAFPPFTSAPPRHHRNALSSLRALPASALRSSSSGWMFVLPFLFLVALASAGVVLIRSEIKRSRPRHRLKFHPIETPADEREDG